MRHRVVARPARASAGRQAKYCSPSWRLGAHRQRNAARVLVEVDHGSAGSRGRPPIGPFMVPIGPFMVRPRRKERFVLVVIGLSRYALECGAEQLSDLLGPHAAP